MIVAIAEATSLKKARRTLDEIAITGKYLPIGTSEGAVVYSNGEFKLSIQKIGIRLYKIIKEKEKY